MVGESVNEEDQCGWRGCGLRMVERSVGVICGDERLFDRPSMSLCILYGRREGYASSLVLHSLPLLQRSVKGRWEYPGVCGRGVDRAELRSPVQILRRRLLIGSHVTLAK